MRYRNQKQKQTLNYSGLSSVRLKVAWFVRVRYCVAEEVRDKEMVQIDIDIKNEIDNILFFTPAPEYIQTMDPRISRLCYR